QGASLELAVIEAAPEKLETFVHKNRDKRNFRQVSTCCTAATSSYLQQATFALPAEALLPLVGYGAKY
ncbi:MAG: hypothetical protein ACJAQW_000969, partial [Paracoccaceae bacterium]